MKLRNIKVAKIIGTKTLAGLLSVGLVMSSPIAAFAEGEDVAVEATQDQNQMQAKAVDGSENMVTVSEGVRQMIQNGEVYLDEASQYLIDATTGQKVNPETGERVVDTPTTPDVPTTPDTPDVPTTPDTPATPENPDTPETPENPDDSDKKDDSDQKDDSNKTDDANKSDDVNQAGDSKDNGTTDANKNAGQSGQNANSEEKKATEQTTETTAAGSNQELIARQQIIKMPQVVEDFRFWTVARKYAFAKTDLYVRESIPSAEKDVKVDAVSDEQKAADVKSAKTEAESLQAEYDAQNEKEEAAVKTDKAKKVAKKKTTKKEKDIAKLSSATDTTKVLKTTEAKKNTKLSEMTAVNKLVSAVKSSQKDTEKDTAKTSKVKSVTKSSKKLVKTAEKKATEKAEKTFNTELAQQQLSEGIRAVGQISQDGLLYVLKEEENGWLYVESGNVRGFVRASEVYTGDAAQELLSVYQKQAKKTAEDENKEYTGIEGTAETGTVLVNPSENQAYTYLRATVNQTVAKKTYALVNTDKLNIREEKSEDAAIVGTMTKGNLCYVLADQDSEWTYIESGDVRGFVKSEYLDTGDEVTKQVNESGEDKYTTAKEEIKPEDNDALYYTLTSTKAGTPSGEIRQSMLEFASQFIGNPYVWGGTSLTNGADCSGFVQQIYKQYGYDLPRVAADQAQYGTKIAVEDAQPGDLIFYAKGGDIYHVVMYAGNGKTIEAANEKDGIIYGNVYTADAVWATRILDDKYTVAGGGIGEVNATQDMYGKCLGNFKITYYCACEICCDVETGITATGTPVVEGQTIAVDPNVIPYGTKVIIGGHVFTAEDCGGAIKENRIDIYVNNHADALALGVANADVYLVK